MTVQYTIPFAVRPDFSRQALIPHRGLEPAQAWLARYPDWPTSTLILSGPAAGGKSHLAAHLPAHVPVWDLSTRPLTNYSEASALFHLINEQQANRAHLVILSRLHPTQIYPDLPDLDSRLKAASHVRLHEPEDAAIRQAILFKMCTDHQLRLDMDVAAYVCMRLPQTLAALRLFCVYALEHHDKAHLSKIAARPLITAITQILEHGAFNRVQ